MLIRCTERSLEPTFIKIDRGGIDDTVDVEHHYGIANENDHNERSQDRQRL